MTTPAAIKDGQAELAAVDVAIIGAGVVGAAIARELTRYRLDVALVEGGSDVGGGTSKANTAILHTGFDTVAGSLESRLVTRGYHLLKAYAEAANIAAEITGALLVAWTADQHAQLGPIRAKAVANGVTDLRDIAVDELYRMEPSLGPGARGALLVPGEGIICPYSPPLAFAYEAVANDAKLLLNSPLTAVRPEGDRLLLTCGPSRLSARWVINAAGLESDTIDGLFGFQRFRIKPRRGQLIVFDKLAAPLVRHVLLPVPTARTKGVLVSPTVFGNVLLGPTAEDLDDRNDRATTADGLADLLAKGRAIMPALEHEEVTATYAGLRAATEHQDYQIHVEGERRYICVGGIRSTGLSASLAIAEYVRDQLARCGLPLAAKSAVTSITMPNLGERSERPFAAPPPRESPGANRIVCHCERVTQGELQAALAASVPARTLDGLRRRTRCLQGRCQGFYCLAEVVKLAAITTGTSPGAWLDVPK